MSGTETGPWKWRLEDDARISSSLPLFTSSFKTSRQVQGEVLYIVRVFITNAIGEGRKHSRNRKQRCEEVTNKNRNVAAQLTVPSWTFSSLQRFLLGDF